MKLTAFAVCLLSSSFLLADETHPASLRVVASSYAVTMQPIPRRFTYRILHWNVESGGSDPAVIGKQLVELVKTRKFDIVGLSEVNKPEVYEAALKAKWPDRFGFHRGNSGRGDDRADDRLWFAFDKTKFEAVETGEMEEAGGIRLNNGGLRSPLYIRLEDKKRNKSFVVVLNHLARGNAEFRQQQARGLREWARGKSVPVICVGDFNFDFVFKTQRGNRAFGEFVKDGVWKWVKPTQWIDSNWSDRDRDGVDDYPGSMLDFSFVAGSAKRWKAKCNVIVRKGDFPDNRSTSDHRPVALELSGK